MASADIAANRGRSRCRVAAAIAVLLTAPAAAALSFSAAASGGRAGDHLSMFVPPPTAATSTTTTTPTTTTPVIVAPPTSPATTSTAPLWIAVPTTATTSTTTTSPASTSTTSTSPAATSTTTPVIAQPPAPGTTRPPVQVASTTATTAAPVIAQEPATTTTSAPSVVPVPLPSGDPLSLGTLSSDPDDWSDEVKQYLQAEGLDLEALANQNAGPAGTPGQLLSNEGCAVNCITSGLARAVGVGVHLEVTTSVPAFIQIEILDVGLKFGPPSAQIWGATWPHLEPNTTYQAVARAHDAQGNMAVASGEFTTATRYAGITLEPTVFWFGNLPDFDPWGDYLWTNQASAYLNGAEVAVATDTPHPTLSFDTGAIDPSVIEVAYVGVYDCVLGCEDISFWDLFKAAIFGPGPQGAVPPMVEHGGGVTPTAFWGTVANGIQLDGYPDTVTSWTGHEFTFPLSTFWGAEVGPPVYLTVNVTVEVWYELQ